MGRIWGTRKNSLSSCRRLKRVIIFFINGGTNLHEYNKQIGIVKLDKSRVNNANALILNIMEQQKRFVFIDFRQFEIKGLQI